MCCRGKTQHQHYAVIPGIRVRRRTAAAASGICAGRSVGAGRRPQGSGQSWWSPLQGTRMDPTSGLPLGAGSRGRVQPGLPSICTSQAKGISLGAGREKLDSGFHIRTFTHLRSGAYRSWLYFYLFIYSPNGLAPGAG